MENVTVSDLIALLDKPENRRTDRGTERLIQLDVNGESIGYITSAKLRFSKKEEMVNEFV